MLLFNLCTNDSLITRSLIVKSLFIINFRMILITVKGNFPQGTIVCIMVKSSALFTWKAVLNGIFKPPFISSLFMFWYPLLPPDLYHYH